MIFNKKHPFKDFRGTYSYWTTKQIQSNEPIVPEDRT